MEVDIPVLPLARQSQRLQLIVAWAVIAWVVVFWRLGNASLLDPDEAHYAQLTREMIRARTWLVPLLDGQPYIDKPIFYHWLQAGAVWLFGETAFALRLPAACGAVALFAGVRWVAAQLFDVVTGNRAAVMFATLPITFALGSIAVFDMVYTAFLFGGIATLIVASLRQRLRLQLVAWPLLAAAVMTKGPVALVLVLLLGVSLWASKTTRPVVSRLQWPMGIGFVVLVASPWFVYMAFKFQDRFVRDYLLAGNLWYFTAPPSFSTRRSDLAFYARTFVGALFPWSIVAIGAGIDSLRERRRQSRLPIEIRVLWTWTVVVVAFFTVAGFKLDPYIFPVAPAVCILAAHAWTRGAADRSTWTRWLSVSVVAIAGVMIVAAIVLSATMLKLDLGLTWTAFALPLVLFTGGSGLLWHIRRYRGIPPGILVPTMTLLSVYIIVVVLGLPLLERSRPTAAMGRWVARHAPLGSSVGVVGLDDWRASIRYYTDRRLVALQDLEDVQVFLADSPNALILMRRRDYLALRDAGLQARVIGGRPAIVGRSGRYLRRQLWGRIVVVTRGDPTVALADINADLPDLQE